MTSLTWISSSTPPPNSTNWITLCFGDNKFVAVGRDVGAAAYSNDSTGSSWTQSTGGVNTNGVWQSVVYGNSLFVAVAGNTITGGPIMYSSNSGISWSNTSITGYQNVNWTSICYGEPLGIPTFVAVSSNGGTYNVMTSTNMSSSGGTWTTYSISNNVDLRSVCYGDPPGNPTFVAVDAGLAVYSTNSGVSWTNCSGSAILAGTWLSVCYGNGIFMAVGLNICMISTNGITWNSTPIPNGNWYSVCYADNGSEASFVVVDGSQYVTSNNNGTSWLTPSGVERPGTWLSVIYNPSSNYLASVSYDKTQNQGMYAVLCFKEDTKILTENSYIQIQNLRKGDYVQTLKDGLKKIEIISKTTIQHNVIEERIKDQLYKYSSKEYPELFEDLVLTGGHSILLDSLTIQEKVDVLKIIKENELLIDDKFRLIAFLDKKAEVYEKKGKHTIYHFALEGDYYKNYGVYANGLLVEACSQNMLLNKMQ